MEKKYCLSRTEKCIIIFAIIAAILFIASITVLANMFCPFPTNLRILSIIYWTIIVILLFASGISFIALLCAIFLVIIGDYTNYRRNKISFSKLSSLTQEYKSIRLYDKSLLPSLINDNDIKCYAKLDENKNVVFKINIEVENVADSYSLFLDKFNIN